MEQNKPIIDKNSIDLTKFTAAFNSMIASNDSVSGSRFGKGRLGTRKIDYTSDTVKNIIDNGGKDEKLALSRNFFEKDSIYRRIVIYYATLLKYVGILIPTPSYGQNLSTDHIKKRYFQAIDYVDRIGLQGFCTEIALKVLVDGAYYGIITKLDKKDFSVMGLPAAHCQARYKTPDGQYLLEFNLKYFDTIDDEEARKRAINLFPKEVARAYRKYKNGKLKSEWVFIDKAIALCFQFFDDPTPLFLDVIPASMDYEEAVDVEKDRNLEEIRKIIVQKVPHLNDGQLLFEPYEAAEMHKGTVGMVKGNKNVSVLTTYTDVDAIVSKTSSDVVSNSLNKMLQNIYAQVGTTSELFASTSNLTLVYSVKNDIMLMMILVNKIAGFLSSITNKLFSNSNIYFTYKMLPVSIYTEGDYTSELFKLAQSGYSYIMPAVSMGLSQRELINIKELENDVLELEEKLIPLTSKTSGATEGEGEVGRPEKDPSEKSPKTEANQKAIDNQGNINS